MHTDAYTKSCMHTRLHETCSHVHPHKQTHAAIHTIIHSQASTLAIIYHAHALTHAIHLDALAYTIKSMHTQLYSLLYIWTDQTSIHTHMHSDTRECNHPLSLCALMHPRTPIQKYTPAALLTIMHSIRHTSIHTHKYKHVYSIRKHIHYPGYMYKSKNISVSIDTLRHANKHIQSFRLMNIDATHA